MRCNRYNYTYLSVSCRLVVSLHQILVPFLDFILSLGRSERPGYGASLPAISGTERYADAGHRTRNA